MKIPAFKLSIIPVLLFLFSMYLTASRGPYYLGQNIDPEYPYLFNALNPLHFSPPDHTGHPGTTVQIAGSIIILIRYGITRLYRNSSSIQDEVFNDPESYLRAINLTFNLLLAVSIFLAGLLVYKLQKSWWPAIFFQLSPFLFKTSIIETTTRVKPEPVLMLAVIWLSLILIPVFAEKKFYTTLKQTIFLGVILGFGMATKITIFPLILLVLLSDSIKGKIYGLVSCIFSFLVFTIPIWPRYKKLGKWILDLAIHQERYGGGGVGIPNLVILWNNLKGLFYSEPCFFIFVGLFLGLLMILVIKRNISSFLPIKQYLKVITIFSSIILIQIAITVKHPAVHYLLPSMCLIGIIILAIFNIFKNNWPIKIQEKIIIYTLGIFFLICITLSVKGSFDWSKSMKKYCLNVNKIQDLINTQYQDCTVVRYYTSSSIENALSFGNAFAGKRYCEALEKLYPKTVVYSIWSKKFFDFCHEIKPNKLKERFQNGECFLMQGAPFTGNNEKFLPPVKLEKLENGNLKETLYRIQSF